MEKRIVFLLIIVLVVCNKSERPKDLPTINFQKIVTVENMVPLSEIADHINYTPLDSAILIKMINSLEFADSMFFIGTFPEGLLVYNLQGKLIHKIGKKGNGPGEYTSITDFDMDEKTNLIYILNKKKEIFIHITIFCISSKDLVLAG